MKALNIFGIILAWVLSIAMVLMLIAAPLALSALSLLDTENIAELVGDALVKNEKPAAAQPQQAYAIQMLSAETEVVPEEKPATEDVLGGMKLDGIQDILGEEINEEALNKVLESELVSELLDAYVGDVTNAITGKPAESQFTAEKLVEVVKDNIDEIVEIVEESGVTLTEEEKEQIKTEIQTAVEENAESIIAEIPTPEQIKEELIDGNEGVALAFAILAKKNQIKGMIVGAIVVISLLIFGLRYPGLRGMRWLSSNLFTAGGFNIVICLVLGFGASAVKGITAGVNAIEGTAVDGIIGTLLSQLTTGVIVRTAIIFVAAIALLVGYILLKPFARKKKAKKVEPVAAEPIPTAASVYTSVPVEPELTTEPAPEAAEEPAAETAEETPAEEI